MRPIRREAKKPNKPTALAMVRALRDKYEDEDLDDLLMFFAERPRGKAKTAEQWVAQAVAKKDTREALNYLYVKGRRAYGADGHRAHYAPTDLADGFYCPATLAPVNGGSLIYPDIERVMVKPRHLAATFNRLDSMDRVEVGTVQGKALVRRKCVQGEGYVDEGYITQAVNGDIGREFEHYVNTWFGSSEFGEFVVMGCPG